MIPAFQSTYHTLSERGQHRGSSKDDKDKYKDKVQKIRNMCTIFLKIASPIIKEFATLDETLRLFEKATGSRLHRNAELRK